MFFLFMDNLHPCVLSYVEYMFAIGISLVCRQYIVLRCLHGTECFHGTLYSIYYVALLRYTVYIFIANNLLLGFVLGKKKRKKSFGKASLCYCCEAELGSTLKQEGFFGPLCAP